MSSRSGISVDHEALARHGLEVIRANQATSGAYLASPNFPVYQYCWLRDGAFTAEAMSRMGEVESAEAFFTWCARVIAERADRISELIEHQKRGEAIPHAEFLPARYTVDGAESDQEWTDFQLDGYGTWLWALDAHAKRHNRPVEPFLEGARWSARYIAAFWDQPSYDWWEEFAHHVHTSTLAAVAAGLAAAVRWPSMDAAPRRDLEQAVAGIGRAIGQDVRRTGRLNKWLGGVAVDASLVAVSTPFEVRGANDPFVRKTVAAIERELVHGGGVHRYCDDVYYGGGEWVLLAGLLGWHHARAGDRSSALKELDWMAACASSNGDLPEQVPVHLLAPAEYEPWVEKWGPIAKPLLWSHAMHLILATELGVIAPR